MTKQGTWKEKAKQEPFVKQFYAGDLSEVDKEFEGLQRIGICQPSRRWLFITILTKHGERKFKVSTRGQIREEPQP